MLEEFDPFELALPFGGSGSQELASCELFSVALAKLIFNFLSLIRHGSSYSLGLYANAVVVLLPSWPGLHGAPLFRGCIILPLETRCFLPYSLPLFRLPFSQVLPIAVRSFPPSTLWLRQRSTYAWAPHGHFQLLGVPTWRINNRETNNPETPSSYVAGFADFMKLSVYVSYARTARHGVWRGAAWRVNPVRFNYNNLRISRRMRWLAQSGKLIMTRE